MKYFIALLVLVFGMTTFAQSIPADQIMGKWQAQEPLHTNAANLFLTFEFTPAEVEMGVTCVFHQNYDQLSVSVHSAVVYQNHSIFIQEARQGTIEDGQKYCQVFVKPSRWDFLFNAYGQLVLFIPVPWQAQFTLVRTPDGAP